MHEFTINEKIVEESYNLPTENGNELTGNETIPIGKMLYFEASQAVGTGSVVKGRLYIIKCFLTTSKDPSSEPKYYVIDKGG